MWNRKIRYYTSGMRPKRCTLRLEIRQVVSSDGDLVGAKIVYRISLDGNASLGDVS